MREIYTNAEGRLVVYVRNGKGGRRREAIVLPGKEQDVLAVIKDRPPDAHVFEHLAKHMDIHSYWRQYSQTLYQYYAHWRELPPQRED